MKKKGLSLLEILISVMILAVIMTGLANIFVASKRHIRHSRSRIQTAELGRYFLGPLHMQVRQDQWGSNCLTNTSLCSSSTQSIDNITYTANIVTSWVGTASTIPKATLTITWNEPSP